MSGLVPSGAPFGNKGGKGSSKSSLSSALTPLQDLLGSLTLEAHLVMHPPPTHIPSCFCDIPAEVKPVKDMGGPTMASIIPFQHPVTWMEKEHWILSLSRARRGRAAPRLGWREAAILPHRGRLSLGKEKAARMGPAQQKNPVVERPQGNVNHVLCNRGKNSQMNSTPNLQDGLLTGRYPAGRGQEEGRGVGATWGQEMAFLPK